MLAPFDQQGSVERHINDTLCGGHYLKDPDLVRILVSQATHRALDLDRYGTEFDGVDGRYNLFPLRGVYVAVIFTRLGERSTAITDLLRLILRAD